MPPEPPRFTVAYAPALLPSYEAARHTVIERSERSLAERVARHGGALLPTRGAIVTRSDAEAVAAASASADLVIVQCASFAMGDVVEPFAAAGLRLALWAPAEPRRAGPIPLNGLVALHLHAGILRRRGAPTFGWLFGGPGEATFDLRLDRILAAVKIAKHLSEARIARIGDVAPTFTPMAVDPAILQRFTGATVAPLDLHAVIDAAIRERDHPADPERVRADLAYVEALTRGRIDLSPAALHANLAVYRTLADLAHDGGFAALAVRDWPEFQERMHLHPGLAFTLVDERHGVPVAAEGDVGGALSMLALRAAGAGGSVLLDVVDHDPERDALLGWHCGGGAVGLADAEGVRITRHSTLARGEQEIGAVADLRLRPGPVTLLRIGRDGALWTAVDAEVVPSPHPGFDGTRGWLARFAAADGPCAATDLLSTLYADGVEHHLALAAGHHAAALRSTAAWLGARLQRLHRDRGEPLPPEEIA
jgi:L-fucose isomerase-like protein